MLFTNCSEEKAEVNLPLHIQEMDNVAVYSIPENPDTVRLIKEQAYGDSDDLFFSRMGEFAVDADGWLYIEEGAVGRKAIHVFDPDGHHLGKIGREGRGPGEFEEICCMKITSDKIYVYDSIQSRMSLFSTETLKFMDVFRIERISLPGSDVEGRFTGTYFFMDDGKLLMGFTPPEHLLENSDKLQNTYFYYDEEFRQASSKVLQQEQIPHHWGYFNDYRIRATFPFFEKPLIAVSPAGRIFTAMSSYFLVQELDQDGNYLSSFYYPHKKIEVTQEDAYKSSNEMSRDIAENIELPEYWPVLNSMQFDDEDRLWISTFTEKEDQLKWWVLNTDGELLGTFYWQGDRHSWPLRSAANMKVIRNGYFYERERNEETGIRKVIRYRIEMEEK